MGLPLTTFLPAGRRIVLRPAERYDIRALVELFADDEIGAARDGAADATDLAPYDKAFEAIDRDPAHVLLVAEDEGLVVGTLQLSLLPGMARRGAVRAQIEAVRVADDLRGQGLGSAMFRWAIGEATERGCALVQLTTDRRRVDAHRFYERLGFEATHDGMKLPLS